MILEVWLRHHRHLTIATRGFSILGDPRADSGGGGGEGKTKRAELNNAKKIKERGEEPLWLQWHCVNFFQNPNSAGKDFDQFGRLVTLMYSSNKLNQQVKEQSISYVLKKAT